VHNCQPTTSPAVFPTGHTTKSGWKLLALI
jgi:hypothetical protein